MSDGTASDLLAKWVAAMEKYDYDFIMNMYHDDAVLLGTFSDIQRVGHRQIMEYLHNPSKSPVRIIIVTQKEYRVDSVMVISGLYDFVIDDKTINARFSIMFSKRNNEWRILSHHSSVLPR